MALDGKRHEHQVEHFLLADDDPIVESACFDRVALPPGAEVVRTARGGHLGFVGLPTPDVRFMDDVVLRWVAPSPDQGLASA